MNKELIRKVFGTMEYGPSPESDTQAQEWLTQHERRFGHFIDGAFVVPNSGGYFETYAPGRGNSSLAQIAQGDEVDVDKAVKAAKDAQEAWWKLGGHGRAKYLYAIARHVQKHSRLFAVLESLDNGKPIRESRDLDIPLVARHFYHHAGWAELMESELPGYEPIGVVGQIIPWNFPLLMLSWKIAPALAMGNTLVLKPAEFTPLTALLFAEICREVGLPKGVVNIINGDGRTGAALVKHVDVKKIAFTGSTEVGRIIREQCAGSGKKLSLELGGKSPFLVYEDADLDSVVEGVVDAIWFNQGQVCCAGSRILVQESVAEKLLNKLKARIETLRVGDPLDKCIDVGAIVAPVQLERISELVEQGKTEGATCHQPQSWKVPTNGCFYPPTILSNVSPSATVAQVEIFGPVAVFMTFRTPEESVALANNTIYGLASSVWSENINLALDIAPKIKAGTVWINCTNHFDAASGFGGYRESGFGREGGKEGLYEYAKLKGFGTYEANELAHPNKSSATNSTFSIGANEGIDRTAKLYIGGKQARPDGGYSYPVVSKSGELLGHAAAGNRKDIRNAVEAAHAASGWAKQTAHLRAQVLYFMAENLQARAAEFEARLSSLVDAKQAQNEVELSIRKLFRFAAWADKYDGAVHATPYRNVTLAMNEPIGVAGVVASNEFPLLGFVSAIAPLIAMGNTVVALPSETHPLLATDLYQVFDTSDLPAGVVNIVSGSTDELAPVLAAHDGVDVLWYFGPQPHLALLEKSAAANMKRLLAQQLDWSVDDVRFDEAFLREATQVKNIWVPYGE